ncbi:MAG: transposase [Acidobacteriota bacterium]|nr:transposase [Acidobacteriota bacterium]
MAEGSEPRRWYSRGYLPHYDDCQTTQSITFRLADSYPREFLARVQHETAHMADDDPQRDLHWRKRAQHILDIGHGDCFLRRPRIAELVQDALIFFDDERYHLHAWVVMPNHVHVLITQLPGFSLSSILHSWQSFTAKKANRILGRSGGFWARGNFDRFIRDKRHFDYAVAYIERNPVMAKLCRAPADWPYSSASMRV